jgi:hypothetical protein
MNTKTLLAGLATSVFFFFGGWLIYGMLLADTMMANVTTYEGLMKSEEQMSFPALIVSNLAIGFLIALICDKTNSKSWMAGAMTGLWAGFLIMLYFDTSFMAFYNLFTTKWLMIDIAVGTVYTAAGGAIAGLILGSGNKS